MAQTISRKGEATRRRIIETAADLFHKQGIRATSPDQVIAASGTGKGQFYHYFGSKEGLVHEVLRAHLRAIETDSAFIDYRIESWDDLAGWFRAHIDGQLAYGMRRGCPFATIGNELTERDELLRQDLNLIFEVIKGRLAAFFIRQQATGGLDGYADPASLAEFCIVAIQGGMLLGKIRRDPRPVELAVAEALAHLERYRR